MLLLVAVPFCWGHTYMLPYTQTCCCCQRRVWLPSYCLDTLTNEKMLFLEHLGYLQGAMWVIPGHKAA